MDKQELEQLRVDKIEVLEEKKSSYEIEIEEIEEEISGLQSQISDLEEEKDSFEDKLAAVKKQIQGLEDGSIDVLSNLPDVIDPNQLSLNLLATSTLGKK